jgi:hypothetical protein
MQQSVTRYQQPHSEAAPDLFRLGQVLAMSGYFKDARDEAQAVVKVLAGQEIGIGPVAAMVGIHVVDGKPTFSARLMAALIKRSGRYTYRVKTMSDQECVIEFFEGKESIGLSTFTQKDAATAGLSGKGVWKQYPRNMLFARAMSNGFNWYTPDLSNGLPVYTPEEMGAEIDGETGEVLPPLATVTTIPTPDEAPKLPHPDAEDTGERYHGEILWRVGGVVCVSREAARGGRYLQSTQKCPEHDTPYFLSPDGEPDSWAHGKGDERCVLNLDMEDVVSADELPIEDRETPARERPGPKANAKQIAAIYEAGGARGYDAPETDRLCALRHKGRGVGELTSREASEFLAVLREG